MTGHEVAIVVLNWNGGSDTVECLESLAAADLQGASVLVVDNGSRDDSIERIRARFPAQRILELPENRGYAGGNNAGMRAALESAAGGVLLLNNDTRVAPDFLPPLLSVMHDSPRAAAVTSQILRLDRPELLDVAYLEVHFDERNVVQLQGVNRLPSEGFDRRRRVFVVPGCSLLFRAEALRDVGLFDEAYFAYHEDVDWCLRANARGWEVYYEPFSRVLHRGSRSTERFFRKPPAIAWRRDAPRLPNAEPMPFNPVRTYLGMRNTVRLLRTHAKPTHRLAFGLDLARLLPLETTAVVLGAESWFRLGQWTWRDVGDVYLRGSAEPQRRRRSGAGGRLLESLWLVPAVVLAVGWRFPRDVVRAARSGRLGEIAETLRGLRDGILDRPLPLERLGLR
jgi:GT2 family glycosyltransferase